MSEGAVIEARLYYRDEAGQRVSVAATTIAYSAELFPDRIHFVDFGVGVPVVRPEDPWAGKHIGIEFRSMVGFDLQGGYWDLDQVRFESLAPPVLSGPVISKGEAKFTVRGEPGSRCEIWVSPELGGPSSEWTQVRTLNLANGEAEFVEPVEDSGQRFYRATLLF
jgi:hypothetical protein